MSYSSYERRKQWKAYRAKRWGKVILVAAACVTSLGVAMAIAKAHTNRADIEDAETIERNIERLHKMGQAQDEQTAQEEQAVTEPVETIVIKVMYATDAEVEMVAKTIWGEARGIESRMEQSAVAWTICNRADAEGKTIAEVVKTPYQFYYDSDFPTVDDEGRDLVELARDVLTRWSREKHGEVDVGRVLPAEYLWFGGDGVHNHFRDSFDMYEANYWDWSLPNPYES